MSGCFPVLLVVFFVPCAAGGADFFWWWRWWDFGCGAVDDLLFEVDVPEREDVSQCALQALESVVVVAEVLHPQFVGEDLVEAAAFEPESEPQDTLLSIQAPLHLLGKKGVFSL